MDLSDELKRLDHEHKLEKKRIWLKGVITFLSTLLVVGLAGFLAHVVGASYASKLRAQEIEQQARLELAKHRQDLYYEKRFEGYRVLDSMHQSLYDTYHGALFTFKHSNKVDEFVRAIEALAFAASRLKEAEAAHRPYVDSLFCKQIRRQAQLYLALLSLTPPQWIRYSPYFTSLRSDILELQYIEIRGLLGEEQKDSLVNFLFLPGIMAMPYSGEADTAVSVSYLSENFDRWLKRIDSISRVKPEEK